MFPGGDDKVFEGRFPEEWRRLKNQESGQLLTERGIFSFASIHPVSDELASWRTSARSLDRAPAQGEPAGGSTDDYSWKVISWIDADTFFAPERRFMKKLYVVDGVLGLLLAMGAVVLSVSKMTRRLAEERFRFEADLNAATAEVARSVASMDSIEEAAGRLVSEAKRFTGSEHAIATYCHVLRTHFEDYIASEGVEEACGFQKEAFLSRKRDTVFGQVVCTGEPVGVNGAQAGHPIGRLPEQHIRVTRYVVYPAKAHGEAIGILAVANAKRDYNDRDLLVLRSLAHLFAIAVQRHKAARKILTLAHFDQLTGLVNRHLFEDRVQQMIKTSERHKTSAALVYIDLDKFKPVNDTYGHDAGDHVLRTVAHRLRGAVRASDTVARLGGDEFVVLLPDLKEESGIIVVVDRLRQLLAEPIEAAGHQHRLGASIGVSVYPADGEDADTLRKKADMAMYSVKTSGRGGWKRFSGDDAVQHDGAVDEPPP